MRILVTGGAGFIGSNFVRRTLEDAYPGLEGADVVVYDALTYSSNLANLAPVAESPRYSFVHGDIRDSTLLAEVLPGIDTVVHFAAESHVDRSVRDSGPFVETNVVGTQRLLDASLQAGVGRFVPGVQGPCQARQAHQEDVPDARPTTVQDVLCRE